MPEASTTSSLYHVCLNQLEPAEIDVAEVFSMPEKEGLRGMRSCDIQSGWDFFRSECRKQCLQDIRENQPRVVVVSPPCGAFSDHASGDGIVVKDTRMAVLVRTDIRDTNIALRWVDTADDCGQLDQDHCRSKLFEVCVEEW